MSLMDKHNYDSKVAAYGFGACLGGNRIVSDCFPLNGNPDNPYISGIKVTNRLYITFVYKHGINMYLSVILQTTK